jgi:hypothetical protein
MKVYNYRFDIASDDSEKKNYNGSSILEEIYCLQHPYRLTSMKEHDITEESPKLEDDNNVSQKKVLDRFNYARDLFYFNS